MADIHHTVGSRVWVQDEAEGWVKADVQKVDADHVIVKTATGQERKCRPEDCPLQNPDDRGVEVRPPPHALPAAPGRPAPAPVGAMAQQRGSDCLLRSWDPCAGAAPLSPGPPGRPMPGIGAPALTSWLPFLAGYDPSTLPA